MLGKFSPHFYLNLHLNLGANLGVNLGCNLIFGMYFFGLFLFKTYVFWTYILNITRLVWWWNLMGCAVICVDFSLANHEIWLKKGLLVFFCSCYLWLSLQSYLWCIMILLTQERLKMVYLVKISWNQVGDRIHCWWFNKYETKQMARE